MKMNDFTKGKPTFVGVRLDGDTMQRISEFAKDVPNPVSKGEMHITVVYSRAPIEVVEQGAIDPAMEFTPKQLSIFPSQSGAKCLVLEISCDDIVNRHQRFMDNGASYDYAEYKPHITLSYDCGDFDPASLQLENLVGPLRYNFEYAHDLNLDWKTK